MPVQDREPVGPDLSKAVRPPLRDEPKSKQKIEGQRRQASVLFADMASYTAIAEKLGEEKTYLLMQRIFHEMTEAVEAREGKVQDLLGDGLLAVFGAPIAHEDSPLEACKAAADIRTRMLKLEDDFASEFGVRPKFRIGIHTGPVVVSAEFKAVGDTVNLAARLQTEAKPNSILISEATHELVSGFFDTEFLGERQVKGKSELQRVYTLGAQKAEMSRFDVAVGRGLTPFVARDSELALLEKLWAEAREGRRGLVHIEGEPGIGKSRLIFEFRHNLGDASFVGQCTPAGQSIPFKPFINIIRSLFIVQENEPPESIQDKVRGGLAELGLKADEFLPYLLNLLGQEGNAVIRGLAPEVVGIRTRHALSSVLREHCIRSPLVVIIEDLHWIDAASEEWLLRLARDDDPALPLLIVTSSRPHYRPPWSGSASARSLTLQPLSDETTVELLQKRIGATTLPPKFVTLALGKTQGNPLFLEEITNYLFDNGQISRRGTDIDYRPAAAGFALPISLDNLLLERFDRLDEGTRRVLESASVIGSSFSQDLVEDASKLNGAVAAHLLTLESKDLIFREPSRGAFRFKHALVQDAIYNRLLTHTREELHERVAHSIEQRSASNINEVVDILADHYAETRHFDKTAYYMALAGAKALQVYSLDEAERRFRRVLELGETNPGCADELLVTDVVTKLARLFYYKGEFNNIIALVEPYLSRVAALGDKRKEFRCLFEVGYACMFSARGKHGKPLLEKALAIGEELEDAEAVGYAGLGLLYFYGLWGGASQENDQAVAALRQRVDAISLKLPDVWVRTKFLNTLWSDAISHGRFTEGHELCLELFELSRSSGDPRPMGFGYWQTALNDLTRDQPVEALKNARQSMQVALAPIDHLFARSAEGGALALLGRAEEAVTVLADVVKKSQARGLTLLIMTAGPFYGASMALAGQLGRGIRYIHASIKQTESWGNPYWPVVGYVLLGEIYLQIATAPERPPFRMIIRNLLFVLTNVPIAAWKARRYFEEAIRRSRSVNAPGNLARALLGLGMLNAARKQTGKARTYLTEAAEVAEAVRDENIADKARKALAAL